MGKRHLVVFMVCVFGTLAGMKRVNPSDSLKDMRDPMELEGRADDRGPATLTYNWPPSPIESKRRPESPKRPSREQFKKKKAPICRMNF